MLFEYLLSNIAKQRAQQTHGHLTLNRQLYLALRTALHQGELKPGDRLPSSRDLANDLNLSRNTVVSALQQLEAEGYITTQVGSGTYVSESVRALRHSASPSSQRPMPMRSAQAQLSQRGEQLCNERSSDELEVQPFTSGVSDFSCFPLALWQRLQTKHWRMAYAEMLDYNDSGGFAPLRRAIADYLRMSRAVHLRSEQVIVTTGTQQSLQLCAQLLADPGDAVWVEDPLYWGAAKMLRAMGVSLTPVAVDEQGMNPAHAPASQPRMIYLTPSHQYPTGAVMTLERRQAMLAKAHEHQAWILEDDYDSEFRFNGPPLSSMQGMDTTGRVIYMGTFSKALYPGIKLGYLVVPESLSQAFLRAHYDLNRPGQVPLQAAMAEFMAMGHFATTLRRARQHYATRRAALLQALQHCLGAGAHISGADQGLHLCIHLPLHVDDEALARQATLSGLTVRPLSVYCLSRKDLRGLVIGYGYAPLKQIEQEGPVLARMIAQCCNAK